MTVRGRFIVLEGGEGAGKSTVLAALAKRLRDAGHTVVETREPGGTALGERIRALILEARGVGDPLTELLLFEAARAHLVATVIRPALDRGEIVLCDRFAASSIAYQGEARGLGRDVVERANAVAMQSVTPDLTLLLDLPVDVGLARRTTAGDANHFDQQTRDFHERVRAAFLSLANESSDAWTIIDAAQPIDDVFETAWKAVQRAFQNTAPQV